MGIFYRAHHVYYRAACRAGKGAGGCADSGKPVHSVLAIRHTKQGDKESVVEREFHSVVVSHGFVDLSF